MPKVVLTLVDFSDAPGPVAFTVASMKPSLPKSVTWLLTGSMPTATTARPLDLNSTVCPPAEAVALPKST